MKFWLKIYSFIFYIGVKFKIIKPLRNFIKSSYEKSLKENGIASDSIIVSEINDITNGTILQYSVAISLDSRKNFNMININYDIKYDPQNIPCFYYNISATEIAGFDLFEYSKILSTLDGIIKIVSPKIQNEFLRRFRLGQLL